MSSGPIFVVGASRSGTALLRSCLNQHSVIHLSGETHYFDDLRSRLPAAARSPLTPQQRARAEDYFLALAHRPYGHGGEPAQSPLGREELRAAADEAGVGLDAYFEAFCRIAATGAGKIRWGEKTPRHVFRLPEILRRYPEAQVVGMVRDPRAVVASYRDWRHQGGFDLEHDPGHDLALAAEEERARRSYDPALAAVLWRSTVQAAVRARAEFGAGRVRVQRYEDLVTDPGAALRDLARWLGVEFEQAMLDVPIHNSSFSRFTAHGGISKEPLERWRTKLDGNEVATIQLVAGAAMRAAGYEVTPVRSSRLRVGVSLATLPVSALRAASVNRRRIGSLGTYVWRRLRLALSSP